jgi:hypothetical protein
LGKHGKTRLGSQSLGTGTIDKHMEMHMEIYILSDILMISL